jgi:hypothetical protein
VTDPLGHFVKAASVISVDAVEASVDAVEGEMRL